MKIFENLNIIYFITCYVIRVKYIFGTSIPPLYRHSPSALPPSTIPFFKVNFYLLEYLKKETPLYVLRVVYNELTSKYLII